jgi:hypothetical protein
MAMGNDLLRRSSGDASKECNMNRSPRTGVGLTAAVLAVAFGSCVAVAAPYKATVVLPPHFYSAWTQDAEGLVTVGSGFTNAHPYLGAFVYDLHTDTDVDLHPAGFQESSANSVFGDYQAGSASSPTTTHAFLWKGTAASGVDLHPPGYLWSDVHDMNGNTQVGVIAAGNAQDLRAALWHGTAASAVQLQSAAYTRSEANGVWGDVQVGWGNPTADFPNRHALLWKGTADSVVDLHPASGFASTEALGAAEGSQVGIGYPHVVGETTTHALLWHNTAASIVDLHPSGLRWSEANAASATTQVGTAGTDVAQVGTRAYAWFGTAASAVDLHAILLTADFSSFFPDEGAKRIESSRAVSIDANGVIFGSVRIHTDNRLADLIVYWTPTPEPGALVLATIAGGALTIRRLAPGRG